MDYSVNDAVPDRVSLSTSTQLSMPVRLLVLRVEKSRPGVIPSLYELEDEPVNAN